MRVSFTIPGPPVAWRAARSYRIPGTDKIGHYSEKKTKEWKARVALCAAQTMMGKERFEGPVDVTVWFYLERPRSRPKKYKLPDRRPDGPNYERLIHDAMLGIVYRDDAQLCNWQGRKRYATNGPYTEIIVKNMEDEE